MEILSANLEGKGRRMSDVALARELVAEIASHCWRGKGDMIDRVHTAVSSQFPNWTRRRIRAFWHREAASVRYHEMIELAEVARAERDRRKAIEEARKDHADFVARTARLEALLVAQDADFHCDQIEALGCVSRGMGRAGDQG